MKKSRRNSRYLYWMALRNLTAKKSNKGLSTMTKVSIVGVTIGVAALIMILSVMGGFEQDLKNKMLRGQPHLEITAENAILGFSLNKYPLEKFIEIFPEATSIEPFIQSDVVVKQRKHISAATLFGIDPSGSAEIWGFGSSMIEGELSQLAHRHESVFGGFDQKNKLYPGIVLGDGLATQLSAEVGDEISIITPHASLGDVLGGQSISRTYVVVGKFRSELFNYDNKWAVVSLSEARRYMPDYGPFLDEENFVGGVAFNVPEPEDVDRYAERLKTVFPKLQKLTWKMTNSALLFALKLEKFAMGSILMLIVLVAAFSISGTLMMTVFHKKAQVALLRSLGMTRTEVVKLFIAYGMTIGGVGVFLGCILGLSACTVLHFFQFITLPEGVYYLTRLPVKFLPLDYLVICLGAATFSLVAAWYPAFTASRQDPTVGLRYE